MLDPIAGNDAADIDRIDAHAAKMPPSSFNGATEQGGSRSPRRHGRRSSLG